VNSRKRKFSQYNSDDVSVGNPSSQPEELPLTQEEKARLELFPDEYFKGVSPSEVRQFLDKVGSMLFNKKFEVATYDKYLVPLNQYEPNRQEDKHHLTKRERIEGVNVSRGSNLNAALAAEKVDASDAAKYYAQRGSAGFFEVSTHKATAMGKVISNSA